jgi:hypothetical protein
MNTRPVLAGIFLFVLGLICGAVLEHPARAQNAAQNPGSDQGQWILEPMNRTSVNDAWAAYEYNRQTGEAFLIEKSNKIALKSKQ